MTAVNYFKKYSLWTLVLVGMVVYGCGDEVVPPDENPPETITDVKLIFTNVNDATDVVEARAEDPDGEGVEELKILDEINLGAGKTYTLTYEVLNSLVTPAEDIGAEIAEEDDEHQLFFSFTEGAFSDPTGNGNIDNASDPINYNDADGNGNPVGLSTNWTTSATAVSGASFTAKLQHQPDEKTATSTATTGDTDFDLTFVLNIQ
ncbi:MAG: GTP cyclohydrolase [Bacteroidota bacterium]